MEKTNMRPELVYGEAYIEEKYDRWWGNYNTVVFVCPACGCSAPNIKDFRSSNEPEVCYGDNYAACINSRERIRKYSEVTDEELAAYSDLEIKVRPYRCTCGKLVTINPAWGFNSVDEMCTRLWGKPSFFNGFTYEEYLAVKDEYDAARKADGLNSFEHRDALEKKITAERAAAGKLTRVR